MSEKLRNFPEDRVELIKYLGLTHLVNLMCEQWRIIWNFFDPDLQLTEEEQQTLRQAQSGYKKLEAEIRSKFEEFGLNDNQTGSIMDYIATEGLYEDIK